MEDEKNNEQTPTLEDHFASIEEILTGMEQPGVTLDESFSLYQRGIAELKSANEILDGIEQKMLVLTANGELESFE